MRNRILLEGTLNETPVLRHTPAGIPIAEGVLEHESQQQQGSHSRTVRCQVRFVVTGSQAREFSQLDVPVTVKVKGFLGAHSLRQPDRLVLHIDEYEFSELRIDHVPT